MIAVRRTYLPKPGTGGKLAALVREASEAMEAAGYRKPTVYKGWHGLHGMLQTEQLWDSIADYETSRSAVRKTPGITSIFDQIYPLLTATHTTDIFEISE
ncbi:MAG TPA: hypothetical protein EYQ61_08370 [Dehalococcoidia bacterium]|jgi:hypothetical protein|nr:hypothetical protein [Dehalococcoidia bacterium]HIK88680.1 hypothetical protein [Dehalococcoidia bacterium]